MEVVSLERNAVLADAEEVIHALYFPHNAVLSLVAVMRDGRIAETGTVGREGFTGSEAVLTRHHTSSSRCIVQIAGDASRVEAPALRLLLSRMPHARELLLAHTQALLSQVLQSVACNAMHTIQQRCARWLLMNHDRAESDTIQLTQEFLAEMLGARRSSVNLVAANFQRSGLIRYSRGVVTILSRPGLEAASCECYGIVRRRYKQLLSVA